MTLYCKREVVDAIKYTGNNVEQLNEFSFGKVTSFTAYNSSLVPALLHKNGVEQVVLPPGDYLVKRQDGTFYVEKKEIFEKNYTPV